MCRSEALGAGSVGRDTLRREHGLDVSGLDMKGLGMEGGDMQGGEHSGRGHGGAGAAAVGSGDRVLFKRDLAIAVGIDLLHNGTTPLWAHLLPSQLKRRLQFLKIDETARIAIEALK